MKVKRAALTVPVALGLLAVPLATEAQQAANAHLLGYLSRAPLPTPSASPPETEAAGGPDRTWVELAFRPWVARISGEVIAREGGTPSETMGSLRFGEDLDLSGPGLFLEGAVALHVTSRDTVVGDVLVGSSSGTVRLAADTPFDDVVFAAGERADTEVSLLTWSLGYRRRLWATAIQERPLTLEGGIGVRRVGSITKIRTASAFDSESVAGVIPYLDLGMRLAVAPRLFLQAELQGGPRSIEAFSDEPAEGRFLSAKVLAEFLFTKNLSVQAGLLYFNTRLRFRGTERDGDQADNRTDLGLLGGTIALAVRF